MSSAYQHLALVDVRPGMVLSNVLLDQQGQVLLPEGAVLTEAIIALLPRHGVERLAVLRAEAGAAAAPDQDAQRARIARLFRRHAEDDAVLATGVLRQYVAQYRLGPESDA